LEKTHSFLDHITPEDRIYYTRIIFAFISAALVLGLNLWGPLGLVGFGIGLALIILSYFLAVYLLGVDPQEIGGHVKGLVKGLGTGILLFLLIYLLGFNFIYAATTPPP
jgi:hypothetical protein